MALFQDMQVTGLVELCVISTQLSVGHVNTSLFLCTKKS